MRADSASALGPVHEFIGSAVRNLKEELPHVGEILRRVSIPRKQLEDALRETEREMAMLDLLDRNQSREPEKLHMLRCILGRAGSDVGARLSFLRNLDRPIVQADVEESIGELNEFRHRAPVKLWDAVDHAINRLEQIANWMAGKGIPEIRLGLAKKRP